MAQSARDHLINVHNWTINDAGLETQFPTDWIYRKEFTLSRPSGQVGEYQLSLVVGESPVSELITNGSFSSDTTGWLSTNGSISSIAGGVTGNCLELTRSSGVDQWSYQILSLTIGKRYTFTGYVKSGTSGDESFGFYVSDSGWNWSASSTGTSSGSWTKYTFDFIPSYATIYVFLYKSTATAGTMLFDEISVKECNVDCNSHCNTDFSDLRFTTSDGETLLNYWIESISGTTPNQFATIWIKFDSIGTTDTTFYMYYGNSFASAYSNGNTTFPFYIDKDSTDEWVVDGNMSVSTSGDFLRFLDSVVGSPGNAMKTISIPRNSYSVEARVKNISLGSLDQCIIVIRDYLDQFSNLITPYSYAQNNWYYTVSDSVYAGGGWTEGTEHVVITRIDETNPLTGISYYVCNSSRIVLTKAENKGFSSGSPTNADNIWIYGATNGTCDYYVKWLFIRQCSSINPSWGTWGPEESL